MKKITIADIGFNIRKFLFFNLIFLIFIYLTNILMSFISYMYIFIVSDQLTGHSHYN